MTYGLGTVNENLPAFVVLPDIIHPQGGSANWSNGFLPAQYQGTEFRPAGPPILDLNPPSGVSPQVQRQNLDLLRALNEYHQERQPWHGELAARIESYELAYRMQAEVPAVVDVEKEPEETRRMYGVGEKETDSFGGVVSWPGVWLLTVCASFRCTPPAGIPTITSSARTLTGCAPRRSPSPGS